MQTTLKGNKLPFFLISISIAAPACANDELLFLSSNETQVSIKVKNHRLSAKELRRSVNFKVSGAIADHLLQADKVRVIADKVDQHGPLFMVLSVEPSRPNSMGRGYCGAGYESYLLLMEISGARIELRDQLLLQSCLTSISVRVEHGNDLDDVENGLTANDDGSFSYRLIEDEVGQERNLVVRDRRFKVSLVTARDHSASE